MKRLFLALVSIGLLSSSANAVMLRDRLVIGGGYGVAWPEHPGDFRSAYDDAQPAWTGFLGYGIGQDVQLRASYTNIQMETKAGGPGEVMFQPILLSFKIHVLHDVPVSPYFLIGAGFSDNQIKAPAGNELSWTDFAAQAGFGLEFFLAKEFSLGAEGRYDYIKGDSDITEKEFQVASVFALANFYFGPEDRTGDKHAAAPAAPPPPAPVAAPVNTTVIVNDDVTNAEENERLRREAEAAAAAAAASAASVQKAQQEVEELKARIARKEIQPIMFETGSNRIRSSSNATLDEVARIANADPALNLTVEGHTDNVGSDAANQTLSQGRAEAVKSYLVGQGVAADRITATGYGESKPVNSNDSAAGRETNRRVEFVFGE